MLGKLLPKETSFFDFFEEHAALSVSGARELQRLVTGQGNRVAVIKRIGEIETEADTITHRCVEALHRTFVTPIERDDIHMLISRMDDILDYIEEAAECIGLYKLETMTPEAGTLAGVLVRATEEIQVIVGLMRRMENAEAVTQRSIEVKRLESEGDAIYRTAMSHLFEHEADLRKLIKWKEIYENLEMAIDRCEDCANVIEGVILEQT
jgi:uncharacterized protein